MTSVNTVIPPCSGLSYNTCTDSACRRQILQNVGDCWPKDTAPYVRRIESSPEQLWELQISTTLAVITNQTTRAFSEIVAVCSENRKETTRIICAVFVTVEAGGVRMVPALHWSAASGEYGSHRSCGLCSSRGLIQEELPSKHLTHKHVVTAINMRMYSTPYSRFCAQWFNKISSKECACFN
jgi:hypothetical protein